jgi:hypothetical protein
VISTDNVYPLLTADLINASGLNSHEVKCLLWKLKIKNDKRYHNSIKIGQKSEVHKYSKTVLELLNRYKNKEGYLKTACEEYAKVTPQKEGCLKNLKNEFNFPFTECPVKFLITRILNQETEVRPAINAK